MLSRSPQSLETPHIGGKLAFVIFVLTLLAFVIESQLTQVALLFCLLQFTLNPVSVQYVQTTLGYRQPFFILCGSSKFIPVHACLSSCHPAISYIPHLPSFSPSTFCISSRLRNTLLRLFWKALVSPYPVTYRRERFPPPLDSHMLNF